MQRMRQRLLAQFTDAEIEVEDESHLHAGHAGARSGRGHFRLKIAAKELGDLSPVAQHRAIYRALGDMMQTDIHALSIQARGI